MSGQLCAAERCSLRRRVRRRGVVSVSRPTAKTILKRKSPQTQSQSLSECLPDSQLVGAARLANDGCGADAAAAAQPL